VPLVPTSWEPACRGLPDPFRTVRVVVDQAADAIDELFGT
jgi:hypothetical protein